MGKRKGRGANKYTAYTFINDTHKRCSMCEEIKLHSEFYIDKKNIYGRNLSYYCKVCARKNSRKNHADRISSDTNYKQKKKDSYIKSRYGLTIKEYAEKLAQQKNCAICGVELFANDQNTHLDHCHKTGKIRAFLCGNCNRGIGSFHDNVEKLRKAIQYLESHNTNVDSIKEVLVNDCSH